MKGKVYIKFLVECYTKYEEQVCLLGNCIELSLWNVNSLIHLALMSCRAKMH